MMEGFDLVQRTLERYVTLAPKDLERLAPCWERVAYEKGEHIAEAGRVAGHFHIVESGVQRLYLEHDGNAICLGFAYAGTWSGDPDSFFSQRPGRFHMQALTPSVLWRIAYHDLQAVYDAVPVMERFMRLVLEELIVGRATREVELLTLDAAERYRRFVTRSPHLLQLVPQKDIASYLGMTPETFSRLRARSR